VAKAHLVGQTLRMMPHVVLYSHLVDCGPQIIPTACPSSHTYSSLHMYVTSCAASDQWAMAAKLKHSNVETLHLLHGESLNNSFMAWLSQYKIIIQWNLFIMDTLGPAISGSFLLLYRGFPLSEVKMY